MKCSNWTRPVMLLFFLFSLAACGGGGGGGDEEGNPVAPPATVNGLNLVIKSLAGILDQAFGAGVAVNELGQSVGVADNGLTLQAVRWDATLLAPTPTVLTSLAGDTAYSAAYAINDNDIVVGESSDGSRPVAVFWPSGSTVASPLSLTGFFPGGTSAAYGINENAEIVGETDADLTGNTVAVYWSSIAAAPIILDNLSAGPAAFSSAYNINNFQVIVGESLSTEGSKQPTAWLPDGSGGFEAPIALPLLPGHVEGVALDINDSDEVAGESQAADGTVHGVAWSIAPDGSVVSTTDLGPNTSLDAINDSQLLAGYINAGSGNDVSTLWKSTDITDSKEINGAFSQTYDLNDKNWSVGIVNGQAFVAIPE